MLPLSSAFLGLVQRLGILDRSGFGSFSLELVLAMVFCCSLSLDFVSSGVGGPIPSKYLLVSFPYVGTWL